MMIKDDPLVLVPTYLNKKVEVKEVESVVDSGEKVVVEQQYPLQEHEQQPLETQTQTDQKIVVNEDL